MTSLRQRLRRVVIVLVVGLLSQWFIADRMIVHVDESEMTTRLQHDADSLAATFAVRPDRGVAVDYLRVGQIYRQRGSGHYFVVRSGTEVLASPSFGDAPAFAVPNIASESVTRIEGPFGQPLLVLLRRLRLGDAAVELAVGEDLSVLQRQVLQFRLLFFAASAIVLLASAAVQRHEIGRALASVEQARDAVLGLP